MNDGAALLPVRQRNDRQGGAELSRLDPVRQVQLELDEARVRVVAQMEALERSLAPALHLRETVKRAVRRHPMLMLGGVFVVGYGMARLLFGRPPSRKRSAEA